MDILTLTLLVPPTLNHAYTNATARTRTGKTFTRRILTADARAAMDAAALTARNAAQLAGWRVPPKARLALTLRLFFPRDTRDGDNAIKLVQDALASGLGFNDKQIKEWHVYSAVDKDVPRCEVELRIIGEIVTVTRRRTAA